MITGSSGSSAQSRAGRKLYLTHSCTIDQARLANMCARTLANTHDWIGTELGYSWICA